MLSKSRIPAYRHHKARNLAVVRINGVDHYLGPWKSKASYVEYDLLIGEWLARGRTLSIEEDQSSRTVVEVMAAYLCHARSYYRKNGRVTREVGCIKEAFRHLRRLYGASPADKFGPVALQSVRQSMIESGWSRKYINKQIGRVVRAFRWATSQELIVPSVYQSLSTLEGLKAGRTSAPDRPAVKPVPDLDVEKTLEHLGSIVGAMVRLQRLTGMRPSEVCAIRPGAIEKTEKIWTYRPPCHKTEHLGRERTVFIGPKAQAILAPYLLRDASAFCLSPIEAEEQLRRSRQLTRKTPLSCGSRPGTNRKRFPQRRPREQYDVNSYRRAIHRACDRAGVERWGPNRLRHSAATEIRHQFGLEAAQVALGHAAADVTQVYAERDIALAKRVAAEVG